MLSMACALAASFWHVCSPPYLVTGNVGCPLPPIQCGMTAFSVFLLPICCWNRSLSERLGFLAAIFLYLATSPLWVSDVSL